MDIPMNLNPSVIFAGLSYLLIFRLAVILLGGLSIYLGYRLFTQSLPRRKSGETGSELEARFGNNELTLRSVAPGIFFAAFGSLITIVALAGNAPEFRIHAGLQENGKQGMSAEVRGAGDLPATLDKTNDALWEKYAEIKLLADHAASLATEPKRKAEALAIQASLAFLKGDVQQAIDFQGRALRELPDNPVLQKRLAAYQAAL